jgi:hypothetical protein
VGQPKIVNSIATSIRDPIDVIERWRKWIHRQRLTVYRHGADFAGPVVARRNLLKVLLVAAGPA